MKRRKKRKKKENGKEPKRKTSRPTYFGFYKYSDELIAAVEYLLKQGITRSTEIAERLGISPFTARNIKTLLRRKKAVEEAKRKSGTDTKPSQGKEESNRQERTKDVIEELLSG